MQIVFKKIIGTFALLAIVMGGVAIAVPSDARADFINTLFGLNVDGIVGEIDDSMLVLYTNGSDPLYIYLNYRTNIVRGPIHPGDSVKVVARVSGDGHITARLVKKTDDGQYGISGPVIVREAKFLYKTDDYFVVKNNLGEIRFTYTPSTRFIRATLHDLQEGDHVRVTGRDNGTEFVARLVIAEKRVKGYYEEYNGGEKQKRKSRPDRYRRW